MTIQTFNIAAALRNTGNGWSIIDGSGHRPEHISSVAETSDGTALQVNFDQTFTYVGAIAVSADETFAPLYTAGASVGYAFFIVKMYDRATGTLVAPADVISQNGNWWISGSMQKTI